MSLIKYQRLTHKYVAQIEHKFKCKSQNQQDLITNPFSLNHFEDYSYYYG